MTPDTLLLRQVNPSWIQQGRVTSQVFRPTPKDNQKLSVYDGDQISAEESWKHFTMKICFASIGVMAVTVTECDKHCLKVLPDPTPFPEHAVIDFSGMGENLIKQKSKQLRAFAESRGWLYRI